MGSVSAATYFNAQETGGVLDLNQWYHGGGVPVFDMTQWNGWKLGSYPADRDNTPVGLYGLQRQMYSGANWKDDLVGMLWGMQFRVDNPGGVLTFSIGGGSSGLITDLSSDNGLKPRMAGEAGVALWNLDTGDFVYNGDGTIRAVYSNNQNENPENKQLSLDGLAPGTNVMLVMIDRRIGGWGWNYITSIQAEDGVVSPVDAGAHRLVLQNYDFNTAGDFHGWFEANAQGVKLRNDIVNFSLGNQQRGDNDKTWKYFDDNGDFADNKGFLSSSGGPNDRLENATGILRSPAFLAQGDILEFLISGGGYVWDNNLCFELVRATDNAVLYSAAGEQTNYMSYDFWNLKDYQNVPVYVRLRDEKTDSWAHLELDQIRMVDFAPSQRKVEAFANKLVPDAGTADPTLNPENDNAFVVYGYRSDTPITTLAGMADFLGTSPTAFAGDNFGTLSGIPWSTGGDSLVLRAESALFIPYEGFYTLGVKTNSGFSLSLDGETVMDGLFDGLSGEFTKTLYFEAGWYDFLLDYFDTEGNPTLELYAAIGDYGAIGETFRLLGMADPGGADGLYGMGVLGGSIEPFGAETPEPAAWLLMLAGGVGMVLTRRKWKSQNR